MARAIIRLCQAARLAGSDRRMIQVEQRIRKRAAEIQRQDWPKKLNWGEFAGQMKRDRIEAGVVLKRYLGPRERGVVFISFEYQWVRLAQLPNLKEFAERYILVLAPSWSPPHCLETTLFPALYPDRLLSTISNEEDLRILPRLSSNLSAAPLLASHWVQPELYKPVPFSEKDIDLVMVANFSVYKRHFALFRALRDMPGSVRVVLVGRPLAGRTTETLLQEAAAFGVAGRFELMVNVSDEALGTTLARSKVSVILSRQEGSCVAVAESILADTPVGLYADARVGSRMFINASTGRLFQHHNLGAQLMDFIANAAGYAPRRWALKNGLTCFDSTKVLNVALKREALAAGEEWTEDIAAHHWRPNPVLVWPEDQQRLQPEFDEFERRFGFALGTK